MQPETDKLEQVLRDRGYSLTRPRLAVYTALSANDSMTMNELAQAVKTSVNRATVYRIVELFEELGVITRLQIGWKYKLELSEAYSHHHHHLACLNCGKIVEFQEDSTMLQAINASAQEQGFSVQDHSLEIRGLCPKCQKSV